MTYIDPPLTTDPDELAVEALTYLTTNIPGWTPREGHIEVWLAEALARMVAESRDVASRVPRSIFKYFGQTLLNLPFVAAASATVDSTWTMIDAAGYTIPEDTIVAFRTAGDTLVPFRVAADVVVPVGNTTTATGEVLLEAVEVGEAANDLPAGVVELVDSLAFVDSIESEADTSGGVDEETDEEYLARLVEELQLMAPRPILEADFAVLARRVAGVARATAIDGYNPNDATSNNERMITVALVDEDGAPVSAGVKTAVDDLLESKRELNFVVWITDPTITAIDVAYTVVARSTADPAEVEAAIDAALAEYLNPANWGTDGVPTQWINETTVRYLEVAQVINDVADVRYITSLTVEGGTANVVLSGVAPLPEPGTIAGTVTV